MACCSSRTPLAVGRTAIAYRDGFEQAPTEMELLSTIEIARAAQLRSTLLYRVVLWVTLLARRLSSNVRLFAGRTQREDPQIFSVFLSASYFMHCAAGTRSVRRFYQQHAVVAVVSKGIYAALRWGIAYGLDYDRPLTQ